MDAEKKMGLQILRNENITNIFIRKFIGLGIVFLMLLIMNSCGGEDDPIEPGTPTDDEIVLADKNQSTLEFDAGAIFRRLVHRQSGFRQCGQWQHHGVREREYGRGGAECDGYAEGGGGVADVEGCAGRGGRCF